MDRYRRAKVAEGLDHGVSTSINKTLTTLAAILETAVEYGLIEGQSRERQAPAAPVGLAQANMDRPS